MAKQSSATPSLLSSAFSGFRELLNEKQASEMLGLSTSTLQKYRLRGIGPKYFKFGSAIRYADADLMAFAAEHRINTRSAINA